jgi:hypothetical protein
VSSSTEVSNLIARYAELIDSGDLDGMASLLAEAAVGAGDSTAKVTGHEAIRRLFAATTRIHPDGTPGTKHVTTNLILDIDDESGTASARSYWTVLQAVPGLPLQPILAGRYHDRFVRDNGTWGFSDRRYFIDLVGDVSHHVLKELPS